MTDKEFRLLCKAGDSIDSAWADLIVAGVGDGLIESVKNLRRKVFAVYEKEVERRMKKRGKSDAQ